MPYVTQSSRYYITEPSRRSEKVVNVREIKNAGDLQYAIAYMIKDFVSRKDLNYQTCNDIMGALAGAQMEFYRRTVAPYEDKKIKENGDV